MSSKDLCLHVILLASNQGYLPSAAEALACNNTCTELLLPIAATELRRRCKGLNS